MPSVLAGEQSGEEERSGGRRRHRNKGGKPRAQNAAENPLKAEALPRPPKQERPARQEKAERVEKLPVRAVTDTTAEKKDAADRAVRQQSGQEGKAAPYNRRRPRRRPRGKGPGGEG